MSGRICRHRLFFVYHRQKNELKYGLYTMISDTAGVIAARLRLEDVLAARRVCKNWAMCFAVPPIVVATAERGFYVQRHRTAICFGHKPAHGASYIIEPDFCDDRSIVTIAGYTVNFPVVRLSPLSPMTGIIRCVLGAYVAKCPIYIVLGGYRGTRTYLSDGEQLQLELENGTFHLYRRRGRDSDVMVYTYNYSRYYCTQEQYRKMKFTTGSNITVAVLARVYDVGGCVM